MCISDVTEFILVLKVLTVLSIIHLSRRTRNTQKPINYCVRYVFTLVPSASDSYQDYGWTTG